MSERDPGGDWGWRDPSPPPAWPEDSESSVFGRPTAPRAPQSPRTPPHGTPGDWEDPPYPGGEPTRQQPQYPDPTRQQPVYPGQRRQPQPGPGQGPQRRPGPGHGQPGARRQRRPGSDDRRGAGGRGRPSPDAARGGGGLPFGLGALVGVAGLAAFLAALVVLPWFTAGGEDVTLSDIRTAFEVPETDPGDIVPGAGESPATTLPEGIPTPDEAAEAVQDAVEQEVRDAAAEAAAGAIDTGKGRYLELYANTLWIAAAVAVGLAVLFSTILAPRSMALSLILGFRRLAGVVTVLVGIAHGVALWIVFTGDGAPSPAFGVWLGVGGLAAVLLGAILGPSKR